ncbi:MAG: cyclic nucleotide-binding domain-containing protein [Beijerinckiaceae bacterium]
MSLESTVDHLARVPPMTRLDRDALRLIAFSADQRRLRAGDVLFRKGDASHGAVLVLSGSIALDVAGDGSPAADIVMPGALIGEMALITKTEQPAQAVARENSEVLMISRLLFRRVLGEYPHSAVLIHKDYAERLASMSSRLKGVSTRLDRVS